MRLTCSILVLAFLSIAASFNIPRALNALAPTHYHLHIHHQKQQRKEWFIQQQSLKSVPCSNWDKGSRIHHHHHHHHLDNFLLLCAVADEAEGSNDEKSSNSNSPTRSNSDEMSSSRQKKAGQASRRLERSVRREDRISILGTTSRLPRLNSAEEKELEGLMNAGLKYEEQYCPDDFTEEHMVWKQKQNIVFGLLARYCFRSIYSDSDTSSEGTLDDGTKAKDDSDGNIFYLDGQDAGTTISLTSAGIDARQCFVANRHESTCDALRTYLPDENVIHASAVDALTTSNVYRGSDAHDPSEVQRDDDETIDRLNFLLGKNSTGAFDDIPFQAYYFDGCGGYAPLIVDMMAAAFQTVPSQTEPYDDNQPSASLRPLVPPIALGFSILGGNRNVVDKEQMIVRELVRMVKPLGMRVDHVLDDPERYGIPSDLVDGLTKVDGGTMTTWYMVEER